MNVSDNSHPTRSMKPLSRSDSMLTEFTIFGQTRPLPTKDDGVEYRAVEGYKYYAVGSDGTFWSYISQGGRLLDSPRRICGYPNEKGYMRVKLCCHGKREKSEFIHKLILNAFVGPRPDNWECRHLNNDKADNRLENICWGTRLENANDKRVHGTMHLCAHVGEDSGQAKVTDEKVREIRRLSSAGMKNTHIAKMFNITGANVGYIVKRITWSHVP